MRMQQGAKNLFQTFSNVLNNNHFREDRFIQNSILSQKASFSCKRTPKTSYRGSNNTVAASEGKFACFHRDVSLEIENRPPFDVIGESFVNAIGS